MSKPRFSVLSNTTGLRPLPPPPPPCNLLLTVLLWFILIVNVRVRFLSVFDLLFILFRIALWPLFGKELSPWLFTCAVCILVSSYLYVSLSHFGILGRVSLHGILHRVLKYYHVYSNSGPRMTFDLFYTKANVGSLYFYIGKCLNGPRHANLVLIAYASCEDSGEPAHLRSLAGTSAARSYKQ